VSAATTHLGDTAESDHNMFLLGNRFHVSDVSSVQKLCKQNLTGKL